jgi:hypothetical protein
VETKTAETVPVFWALCYHSNSTNPRAQKWYYVTRAIIVDGKTYAVGPRFHSGGNNRQQAADAALASGKNLAPGTWRAPAWNCVGDQIERADR